MEYQLLNSAEKYSTIPSQEKRKRSAQTVQHWEIGQIIDEKYEIQDILAKDDRKIIYKVRHCQWNIPLAVRSQLEKESQVRFFHQAERWVELGKHPNVVSAYYVQRIGGIPRLFVEYVTNARPLDDYIANEKAEIEIVLDIAIQLCWGMGHAHQKGLLHGDLRPDNIFITEDGEVKIADFRSREGITLEYTPYMPPEQFEKDWPIQATIDIYAFGAILYELCVAELPFKFDREIQGEEAVQTFLNIILTQPAPMPNKVNPEVPEELARLIMQCLSGNHEERPREFDDIIESLQDIYLQVSGFRYPREAPDAKSLLAVDLNNRALSLLDLEEEEKAEEYLEEAVAADPHCTGALINLYLLRLHKNKSSLARLLIETESLLEIDREIVSFYRGKISLEQGGFLEEAIQEVEIATRQFSQNKELLRLQAMLLERLGRYEEAAAIFEELIAIELPACKDIYHLGCCYLQRGKKKKADEIWEKGLAHYPDATYLLLAQGITMAMRGKVADSYNHFRNVCNKSDNFWALLHLAEISAAFGDYVKPYKRATPDSEEASKLYYQVWQKAPQLSRVIRGYQTIFGQSPLDFASDSDDQIPPQWSYARSLGEHQEVHCIALSPDGRLAVAGSADKYVKIWEIETGRCKNILETYPEGTTQIHISHDGHFVVTIGRDNIIMVWDLISGECVAKLEGHMRDVTSAALTCTGYLVSGSLDKTLRIWDLGALACRKILRGHTDKINTVAVTPDGLLAISGGEDGRVGVWDIEQGKQLYFLDGHTEGATCLAVSNDSKWLVSGSWDQNLRIFELESGNCTATLEGHTGTLNCLAITPDSKWILSGSEDKTIRIWDLQTGDCLKVLAGHTVDVTCLAIAANGKFVVSGSWDHSLRIWDLQSSECLAILEGHTDLVNTLAITPDLRFIISGGDDPILRVWTDLTTLAHPEFPEPQLAYLLQRPRSRRANFEEQRKVEKLINQARTKLQEEEINDALSIYREIQNIDGFHYNSKVLDAIHEIAHQGKLCRRFPLSIWKHQVLTGHSAPITCIAVSPREDLVISASQDNTLRIWDIKNGECLAILKGHKKPVSCIDISPNQRFMVSGSQDNSVRLWELETGRCIHAMEGHDYWVEHVKFSPDGRRVISGSRDTNLRIWERKTGHRLYSLTNHTDMISVLKITPDGRHIISGSHDRSLRLWELESGECLHNLEKHSEYVKCVDCLPDKPMVISGGWDGQSLFMGYRKGRPSQELYRP